ncbi:MAG: GyrI-like domain-containing protein [Pseudomonadota bacterium]
MTQKTYTITCIERSAQFIANQIAAGHTPSLDQIAQASNLSKFHFHRLYRLVTGETCAQTITRLRLAKGAGGLDGSPGSVTEAALTAGYSSSQAFAKALKRATGASASQISSFEGRISQVIETFSVPGTPAETAALAVELVSLDPFTVMVRRTEGTYPELNRTYIDLFMAAGAPDQVEAILGWPHGDIGDPKSLIFDCGLKLHSGLPDMPDGISARDEPAGTFICARHSGSYDGLGDTLDTAYAILGTLDHAKPADRPCLFHYLDDPDEVAEDNLRTDIYVPVEQIAA